MLKSTSSIVTLQSGQRCCTSGRSQADKKAFFPVALLSISGDVEKVDPSETSITCRKGGETHPSMRTGDEFECARCGCEVHADGNAAINIAQRA